MTVFCYFLVNVFVLSNALQHFTQNKFLKASKCKVLFPALEYVALFCAYCHFFFNMILKTTCVRTVRGAVSSL